MVVGSAEVRPRVAVRGSVRRRLGVRRRQGAPAGALRWCAGIAAGRRRAAPRRTATADRARQRWRDRPAALGAHPLAAGRRRAQLPPVLRGGVPGRRPRRGPVGVRRVPRRDRAMGARGSRRRAPRRSSRRSRRPWWISGAPRCRDRLRLRARGEDPRARRAAPAALDRRWDDRVRNPRRARSRAREPSRARPARPARRADPGCRRAGRLGGAHPRHPPPDRRRHTAIRDAPARARRGSRGRGRRIRGAVRELPGLPFVPPVRR